MKREKWVDLGRVSELKAPCLRQVVAAGVPIALAYHKGEFTAVSGECNHVKGPLGKGHLEGEYIVCPWHGWEFHRQTGHGKPPFQKACLPRHAVRIRAGHLFVNAIPGNRRVHEFHPKHPLERPVARKPGPIRVVGISATAMEKHNPRHSTSEYLLESALRYAAGHLQAETDLIKLRDLRFTTCGGFYSKSEHACTWPCSFTQMDPKDQMARVYEALVFWADAVLVATPIRWGNAGSLYFKMAERLNCIENQQLIAGRDLINNKVAGFIITGGQDNIQSVAGNMLSFFSQLGFVFPRYPYVGHSRGWAAEDMEHNDAAVRSDAALRRETEGLVARSVALARSLIRPRRA